MPECPELPPEQRRSAVLFELLPQAERPEFVHRMFCHITQNWRGRPLVSHEVVVNLIGATTKTGGLAIRSELDEHRYATGRHATDEQMESLSIQRDAFHGEWNYRVSPRA